MEAALAQNDRQQDPSCLSTRPQESGHKAGLLTGWLQRNSHTGQLDQMATARAASQPGTPVWSDAGSEDQASSLAAQDLVAGSTEAPAEERATKQAPGFTARIGGWLTGVVGGAANKQPPTSSKWGSVGQALGDAVRGGAKVLQKLSASDKVHDYAEARDRLEKVASEVRGPARAAALQRWCDVLRELSTPSLLCYSMSQPISPVSPSGSESDWQQLHAGVAGREGSSPACQVLFLDADAAAANSNGDSLMTFRELFLRSRALEELSEGYVKAGPDSPDEKRLLVDLFGLCCGGDASLHVRLVDALLRLADAAASCRDAGTPQQKQEQISKITANAIAGLKLQAEVEGLDRKMGVLREEIWQRAAEAAQRHKFSSRDSVSQPTGDSDPRNLVAGMAATAEVMHAAARLCQLARARAALLCASSSPAYDEAIGSSQSQFQALNTAIESIEMGISDIQRQQKEGEDFTGRKLAEMNGALSVMAAEVAELEGQREALLAQLTALDERLARARARRADLEEGRNVFEEGNTFTLDALQHQADELCIAHKRHVAEAAAAVATREVVSRAQSGHSSKREADAASARAVVGEASKEYMHAATRHLYFQRAEIQLLLRQLRFCASELQAVAEKQSRLEHMGMESVVAEMRANQRTLQSKYLEAEAAAAAHVQDVASIRAAVEAACCLTDKAAAAATPQPAGPQPQVNDRRTAAAAIAVSQDGAGPGCSPDPLLTGLAALKPVRTSAADQGQLCQPTSSSGLSEELVDLFESISRLAAELEALERPVNLPCPGQQLADAQGEGEASRPSSPVRGTASASMGADRAEPQLSESLAHLLAAEPDFHAPIPAVQLHEQHDHSSPPVNRPATHNSRHGLADPGQASGSSSQRGVSLLQPAAADDSPGCPVPGQDLPRPSPPLQDLAADPGNSTAEADVRACGDVPAGNLHTSAGLQINSSQSSLPLAVFMPLQHGIGEDDIPDINADLPDDSPACAMGGRAGESGTFTPF